MAAVSTQSKAELLKHLLVFVNDNKKQLLEPVLNYRTRHLTVVLENVFQPQNASAVIRSCDIYGVQDLHVIENDNRFKLNPNVAMGAGKWVDVHKYNETENNTARCLNTLKEKGYKIIATSPHASVYTIHDLPLDSKSALIFGTELTGLSDLALSMADEFVSIPMYGFTESFNISVSVAVGLSHLKTRLHQSSVNWHLSENERLDIMIDWAKKCLSRGEAIEHEFMRKNMKQ